MLWAESRVLVHRGPCAPHLGGENRKQIVSPKNTHAIRVGLKQYVQKSAKCFLDGYDNLAELLIGLQITMRLDDVTQRKRLIDDWFECARFETFSNPPDPCL